MKFERMTGGAAAALFVLALAGCSVTTQATSGRDFVRAIPHPVSMQENSLEARLREAADVEPLLRFPARIGLARIGKDSGGLRLMPTPTAEAQSWLELVDDLGPEYGEFVPVSPLIAAMMTPEHPLDQRRNQVREMLETVRLAAARQHLDAVLIYEADATANSKNNPLSIADWTVIGAFVLPSQDVKAEGVAQGILLDVRNGYHYGTVQTAADDKALSARFSSSEAERELARRVEAAAVKSLTRETRVMMRQLKVKLAALDETLLADEAGLQTGL
jgi:hypothetical protein